MELTSFQLHKFHKNVDKSGGSDACWNWKAGVQKLGYGAYTLPLSNKKTLYAHRVAYFVENGPFDLKLHVLHKCDNRKCCNPAHLFLGTHAENMQDKVNKGRQSRMQGTDHPMSKLTQEQVIEIYKLRYKTTSPKLAPKYKVDETTIRKIWNNEIWMHVTATVSMDVLKLTEIEQSALNKLKAKFLNL